MWASHTMRTSHSRLVICTTTTCLPSAGSTTMVVLVLRWCVVLTLLADRPRGVAWLVMHIFVQRFRNI